jgi:hypothetical protein
MDQANYADALVFMALHSDFTVFAVCAFFLWRKGETFNVMIFAASIIIFLEPQPLHIYAGKAWRLKKKQPFPRPRAVREAYGTGYALFFIIIFLCHTLLYLILGKYVA